MLCPDSDLDCDNPGCRRGGCQGRRPKLPLFRAHAVTAAKRPSLLETEMADGTVAIATSGRTEEGTRRGRLVAA